MHSVFEDQIVQVSDLKKRMKYWLDVVRQTAPVTIVQGGKADLIIMRRADEAIHAKILEYTRLVARFLLEQRQGVESQVLPWYKHLETDEQGEFMAEILHCFSDMVQTGDWQGFAYLLQDWQATAESNFNPELLVALEAPHRPEEYIPVERPVVEV
jgi:hypothetical protein